MTAAQIRRGNRKGLSTASSTGGTHVRQRPQRAELRIRGARATLASGLDAWGHARTAAYIAFGLSWCFLAWPWLSGSLTIPYDAKALFQAQLQFLATALHSGQSPFWNPYSYLGLPQIADPQSLIFTPALLIGVLVDDPSFVLLDWYVLLMLAMGGLAIFALCSDRGWHPAARLVAGLTFAFGGAAAWRIQHIAQIQSYAFFAVTLWCLLRTLDRRSFVWALFAGFAGGAMLAAPDQVALLGSYFLLAIYIAHIVQRPSPKKEFKITLGPVLVVGCAALAISIVPIALTYTFLLSSNRPAIAFAEAARGSLHPVSLLTFWVADLFGALDPAVDYWGPYSTHWNKDELTLSQNMCQLYFGVLPALLILTVGVIRRHVLDRPIRIYTVLMAFGLVYAIGAYTPAFSAFYTVLPGVREFRRPVDATFLVGAVVSIMTGYFVHLWLTCNIRRVSDRVKVMEIVAVTSVLLAAVTTALWQGKIGVAWQPALIALGWTVAAAFLLQIPNAWVKKGPVAMTVVLSLFIAADLRANNGANASTAVSPSQVDTVLSTRSGNTTLAFLKEHSRRELGSEWRDRVELLGLGFDWQNCASVHRLENTLGYNPFRNGLVSRAIGARDYNVGADQRAFTPLFPSYRSSLADMLGLRFIASSTPLENVDKTLHPQDLRLVRRTKDAFIYENDRVLPRVLLVPHAMPANFERIITDGHWPAFDARQAVLLSTDEAELLGRHTAKDPDPPPIPGSDRASIVRYDHTVVEVRTNATGPRILVINDIWHPWWKVTVDGRDARLLQANAIFRAVPVPEGKHIVRLEFQPLQGMLTDVAKLVRPLYP